jgi:hypothetical protein
MPATSKTEENIAKVCQTVHENNRQLDRETVTKILTEDLDVRKVCAKMIPKELAKEHCL